MEVTGEKQDTSTENVKELSTSIEENIQEDKLCLDNKECKGSEEENSTTLNAEMKSSFQEVFRDPKTFDFLSSIGTTNHMSDLRKESLYLKFDPCVPPIDDSARDSGLSRFNIMQNPDPTQFNSTNDSGFPILIDLNNPEEFAESFNICMKDQHFMSNENKISHKIYNNEEKILKNEDDLQCDDSKTPLQVVTTDDLPRCALDNPDHKLSVELIDAKKQNILYLRNKIVKRELEHREKLNHHKDILRQQETKFTMQEQEKNPKMIIVKEYEEYITKLTLEKSKSESYFERMRKKLQDDITAGKSEIYSTEMAYKEMMMDDDNLQEKINILMGEKMNVEQQLEKNEHIFSELEKCSQAKKKELEFNFESVKRQKESELKRQTMELYLINNHRKTLELRESSLKIQLEKIIQTNKAIENLIEELMKKSSL